MEQLVFQHIPLLKHYWYNLHNLKCPPRFKGNISTFGFGLKWFKKVELLRLPQKRKSKSTNRKFWYGQHVLFEFIWLHSITKLNFLIILMNLTSNHLYFLWVRWPGLSVAAVAQGEYVTPITCQTDEMRLKSFAWWEDGISGRTIHRDGIWNNYYSKVMQNRKSYLKLVF